MGQSRLNATSPPPPSRVPKPAGGPLNGQGRRVCGLLCKPQSLFSRPGWLGSWTHPPLDSIQEGGCCFFLWIFWIFENSVAQEEEKEEGADLGRNVRVFQGLEGPGAGSHSCQGLEP